MGVTPSAPAFVRNDPSQGACDPPGAFGGVGQPGFLLQGRAPSRSVTPSLGRDPGPPEAARTPGTPGTSSLASAARSGFRRRGLGAELLRRRRTLIHL